MGMKVLQEVRESKLIGGSPMMASLEQYAESLDPCGTKSLVWTGSGAGESESYVGILEFRWCIHNHPSTMIAIFYGTIDDVYVFGSIFGVLITHNSC